ncbi:hypothetical protein N9J50_01790 [Methylophilaceae bacterium]|nr:hypothetical protein [Methylophilaceae bacterium]|tara:strand:+ start:32 stop:655 length:624 start_codon:yes stop_codon:yes gene_type:complete
MAFFTSYTTLQSTIADYLARTDLTDQIPEFIRLAEDRLRRDLRIRQMLKVATAVATTGDSTVSLPSDFLAMKDLHIQGNPVKTIEFLSTSNFFRNAGTSYKGAPNYYTLLGSEFQFAPVPDSDYTLQMVYFYQPDYLSDTNPSNLWLAYTPDLLLYASLGEAEPYLMNDERLQTWASMYDRGLNAVIKSDDDSEYPAQPLSITISKR